MIKAQNVDSLFEEKAKRDAELIALSKEGIRLEKKIIHRLLTCSYDVDIRDGTHHIYMSGLRHGQGLSYFKLNDAEIRVLWKWIESTTYGNCEEKDFIERITNYICYQYICNEFACCFPQIHENVKECLTQPYTLAERIKIYLCYVQKYNMDDKVYETLQFIKYRQYTNEYAKSFFVKYLPDFFEYDKRQYVLGKELDKIYVKFSFSKSRKDDFRRMDDGKFYEYKENTIAEDYDEGCGFSFGEVNKAFQYFQSGSYGEQLMFVKTLSDEKYYIREYEYLGKKLKIEYIGNLGNIECIKYILSQMTQEQKIHFFNNEMAREFKNAFGSVETTIGQMKEYDTNNEDKQYEDAIKFLLKEQKRYSKSPKGFGNIIRQLFFR